jgi:hypothetical protein
MFKFSRLLNSLRNEWMEKAEGKNIENKNMRVRMNM